MLSHLVYEQIRDNDYLLLTNIDKVNRNSNDYMPSDVMVMDRYSLILIDPLTGFCGPSGSLAKKYGERELAEIIKTIPRIDKALAISTRTHLVKSEYEIGQFTDGNVDDTLTNLCVPGSSDDCCMVDELSNSTFTTCSTKHEENALSSSEFKIVIDRDLTEGVTRFVIAGFLLEHCVKATAESLLRYIPNHAVEVVVAYEKRYTKKLDKEPIRLHNGC